MAQTNYYNTISVAKGLGIILIVLGHSGCPQQIRDFIYLFHVPLFFFVSGYCFKDEYLQNFKSFAIRKLKGLYVPFVKWMVLFILLHNVFYKLGFYDAINGTGNGRLYYSYSDILSQLKSAFLMNGSEQLLGAFWFVNSLFFGTFLFYVVRKLIKSRVLAILILLSLCILEVYFKFDFPKLGFRTLFSTLYILLGYYFKNSRIEERNSLSLSLYIYIYISIIGLGMVFFVSLFFKSEMMQVSHKTIIPYLVTSLLGIVSFISLCSLISRLSNKASYIISFIGNRTFDILALHFLSFKLVTWLLLKTNQIGALANFPTISRLEPNKYWLLYVFVGMMFPLFYNWIKSFVIQYLLRVKCHIMYIL